MATIFEQYFIRL